MDLNEFVKGFAEQFDDTDVESILPETKFRDLEEWSSLTGMSVMAFVKAKYNKTITGEELRRCNTVENIYNLINSK